MCLNVQARGWCGLSWCAAAVLWKWFVCDLTHDAAAVSTLQWVAHCGFCDPLACGPHHLLSLFVVWFWIVQVISLLVVHLLWGARLHPFCNAG